MALRWRFRRVAGVVVVTLCVLLLLPFEAFLPRLPARPQETPTEPRKARTTNLTYVNNRPQDLSSARHRVARQQRVQSACADSPDGDTMNILVYERKPSVRMSYCVVPKAGCTFWIRVFRFLTNDTGEVVVRSPFEIGRTQAHDASQRQMKMYRLQRPEDLEVVMENSTRFMFARDPYSRVWSAYVDKLLLPDFWGSTGKQIVARRSHPSSSGLACGNDVTFREFIEFIVDQSELGGSRSLNGHWRPIQYVCDPCRFKPFFIGKQETFVPDSRAILQHFELQHLLEGYDADTHRRDEVALLTDYYFSRHLKRPHRLPCALTPLQLAQRLWAAFRLNGLLPPSGPSSFVERLPVLNEATFKRLVYREQERHWEEMRLASFHRRRHMIENYQTLPRELLKRFAAVFGKDFEYFGYPKYPEDIFRTRSDSSNF